MDIMEQLTRFCSKCYRYSHDSEDVQGWFQRDCSPLLTAASRSSVFLRMAHVQPQTWDIYTVNSWIAMVKEKEYVQNSCAAGVIGPQGSNLYFANYSLTVPRDALSAPAIITFTHPLRSAAESGIFDQDKRPLVQMSPTIRCGPDGTKFDKPVTIRCPHTMSNLTCPKMLKVYTRGSGNEWRWDKAGSVKVVNRSMEIQINHFSDVMVAIDLDEHVGAEGGEELPTIDIMLSTMMTRDSAGHLQMHLVITPDNANDHKRFRASLYHQRGNETTRFSEPTRVEEMSPQTAINFKLLNHVTSAVIQTRVTSDGIVSQLAGQCQVEPFDLGPNTTTCDVKLSQPGTNNTKQFTAALNDHFSHKETAREAFELSRSEPEETFDELNPTVIRAIEEIQSSKPCCMMCQMKRVNVVLLKCGHVDLCEDCAGLVYKCPKCSDHIAQRVKVQC